jgi:glycine/D-amino acid oxidase-like deaminating enzyme/nitrite reductase/ring-hydroxylating ferredoxin subunit
MTESLWLSDHPVESFPQLDRNLSVDVAVVGGGITGTTAAYLLKQAGLKVALLDKGQAGGAETGHTTAHLTYVTDQRLHTLVDRFGTDVARLVWDAGEDAILQIEEIVKSESIDCGFERVPGYLHTPWNGEREEKEADALRRDADLAARMGFDAQWVDSVPLAGRAGIRFTNQALFHPIRFVRGMLAKIPGDGSFVFESSFVDEISENQTLHVAGHLVRCDHVVIATHVPLQGKTGVAAAALLQSRLAAYSTYAVSARVPNDVASPASFWDTSEPYYYLRLHEEGDELTAVFGGEDHKTGQVSDTAERFARLDAKLAEILPMRRASKHWSGQVIETSDGLPFIGETAPRQYIATGFAGNGMTFGTYSAMLLRDAVIGRTNPAMDVFRPSRGPSLGGVGTYLKENVDFPRYYLRDRMRPGEVATLDEVPAGSGRIVRVDGKRLAAFRSSEGEVKCCSAVCPHMGCIVHWNEAELSWDCPCHGSRFTAEGKLMAGPAETPLEEHASAKLHG